MRRRVSFDNRSLAIALLAGLLAACNGGPAVGSLPVASSSRELIETGQLKNPIDKIDHIVIIVQENRSFNNLFYGFPGAKTVKYGLDSKNQKIELKPLGLSSSWDLEHNHEGFELACNGTGSIPGTDCRMNGFDKESKTCGPGGTTGPCPIKYPQYSYAQHRETAPYFSMAKQYVLADEMFPTEFGGSFTGHLTLVAGTDNINQHPSQAIVDFPTISEGCDSPKGTKTSYLTSNRVVHRFKGPFPCFTQFRTLAEVMDAGGVSWKYYASKLLDAGLWAPFETISYVRKGPDWNNNIIVPQTKVLDDPGQGNLASVSFVTPSKPDSDHPADHSAKGPSWVASVVNAIGESPYWSSSAIIVVWDDWGGFYDNAPPPQLDYRGLGIRVPCLIISPYAREAQPGKPGYVSHTQYEFGSILRFIEETFGLPSIGKPGAGYTDERANSLDDAFDFTQAPRAFTPIQSKFGRSTFEHEPPSDEPVDTE